MTSADDFQVRVYLPQEIEERLVHRLFGGTDKVALVHNDQIHMAEQLGTLCNRGNTREDNLLQNITPIEASRIDASGSTGPQMEKLLEILVNQFLNMG